MNQKLIPLVLAALCIFVSFQVPFVIAEILWLFAIAYVVLYSIWDQLGKDPPE